MYLEKSNTYTMFSSYWAYRNKITNKIWGVCHVPAQSKKKGAVLLSYITTPFTQSPGKAPTDPHTSYWECAEMARLFSERGYDVDIIDWKNDTFIPKKKYVACIDIQKNLERLSAHLTPETIKVMHVVSAYAEFQNNAEAQRLLDLKNRRGASLLPRRTEIISRNPFYADVMEGFGNKTIYNTYKKFGKDVFPIHASVSKTFEWPKTKDFELAKKHFLWFGGGGAVHKSLDLILEAFIDMPDLTLHIVGPVSAEIDFINEYSKELKSPNIKLYNRPKINTKGDMFVNEKPFTDITDKCGALIYPSCSEGTSGAVIQAMHTGLIPIISPETGINEGAPIILITNPTVAHIQKTVREFTKLSKEEVSKRSYDIWSFARSYYSKEAFSKSYASFITTILNL